MESKNAGSTVHVHLARQIGSAVAIFRFSSTQHYPTFTGTSVMVSLPKMSITFTATV